MAAERVSEVADQLLELALVRLPNHRAGVLRATAAVYAAATSWLFVFYPDRKYDNYRQPATTDVGAESSSSRRFLDSVQSSPRSEPKLEFVVG